MSYRVCRPIVRQEGVSMAKKQVVSYSYTCDVCGNEIAETDAATASRKVSWEGSDYTLDVCAVHGSELDTILGGSRVLSTSAIAPEAGVAAGRRRRPRRQPSRPPPGRLAPAGPPVPRRRRRRGVQCRRRARLGPGQRPRRWRPGPYPGVHRERLRGRQWSCSDQWNGAGQRFCARAGGTSHPAPPQGEGRGCRPG